MNGPVLVTGGAGFIGRAVVRHLDGAGIEVRAVDRRATTIDTAGGRIEVRAGDTTVPGSLAASLVGVDTVVHAAAIVSTVVDRATMHAVNVVGTRRLIEAARDAGVRRLVHLSSIVVHGADLPPWVDEDHPVRITGDAYGDTKIAGEQVVLAAHAAGELETVVLRPGDVYGPGSRPWVVLPLTYLAAGQGVLPARGRGLLAPVHVDDVVDAIARAGRVPQAAGQVLLVTAGQGVACRDYLGRLGALVGRTPRCLPTAIAAPAAATLGAVSRARGRPSELSPASTRLLTRTGTFRIDRARRILGYEPRVDLATGMADVARWAETSGLLAQLAGRER
ncbi:MAG: NAD-dependent epimerase/dehydratase family protein [Nitriliruptoraceae bacterium]|nr:NAD-dependent epimerase/dehydratase family protein [Nitriliruptoraceae bacterium]